VNSIPKYKSGDKFEATVVIGEINEEFDEHEIYVVELDTHVDKIFSSDDLDAAFDPNYANRMRQLRIKELEEEIERLKNE
jgi:hypothetical protein